MSGIRPKLSPHAYVLAFRDLPGSAAYFVEVLGFQREWGDAQDWQGLMRDDVRVMLGRCPGALAPSELGDHSYFGFFATNDVDGLHREFGERGARILAARRTSLGVGARWRSQRPKDTA